MSDNPFDSPAYVADVPQTDRPIDRSVGLIVFGVLEVLFGLFWLLLLPMMFVGVSGRSGAAGTMTLLSSMLMFFFRDMFGELLQQGKLPPGPVICVAIGFTVAMMGCFYLIWVKHYFRRSQPNASTVPGGEQPTG